jgi:hypothetical protein
MEHDMDDQDRQERIRRRAHEIWEREGRPDGQHEAHWQKAAQELESETDNGTPSLQETITETVAVAAGMPPASTGKHDHQPEEPASGERVLARKPRKSGRTAKS